MKELPNCLLMVLLAGVVAAVKRVARRPVIVKLSPNVGDITVPARASPVANETPERTVSRITSGLRVIFRRRTGQPCGFSCATSLGPVLRARDSASD